MTETKQTLRRHFKTRLADALAADRDRIENLITYHTMSLPWPNTTTVAVYWARDNEVPTQQLLRKLAGKYQLALPRVDAKDSTMSFRLWQHGDTLTPDALGLLAPLATAPVVQPTIVIAPLMAYDDYGNRLGKGRGDYDRAMEKLPDALYVGLACTAQHSPQPLPAEPHDKRMALVITECGVITPKV